MFQVFKMLSQIHFVVKQDLPFSIYHMKARVSLPKIPYVKNKHPQIGIRAAMNGSLIISARG
jgi:hypothetical protein